MRALVLCAGFGTRLGDLTHTLPKPILELSGRPLVEYVLANLARHGFDEVAINLHFCPDLVREHLGDGSRVGVRLTYVEEPELLGTAGAVGNVGGFLGRNGDFLVHYGDVITDHDLGALLRFHRDRGAAATLLVHRRERANSRVLLDDEGRVTSFEERPRGDEEVPTAGAWVNSGVCIGSRELIERAPARGDLPRDVFPALARRGLLYAQPLAGYRLAVDSPERYEQAQRDVAAGKVAIR